MRPVIFLALLAVLGGCSSTGNGLPEPSALEERGEAFLREGRPAMAKEAFRQALAASDGRSFLACIGLARACTATRQWSGFDAAINQAMALTPRTPEAWDLVGRTLLGGARRSSGVRARRQATLATHFFVQTRRVAPRLRRLTYHVGLCKVVLGEHREAVPFLERAAAEEPASVEPLIALVHACRKVGARKRLLHTLEARHKAGLLPRRFAGDLKWARAKNGKPAASSRSSS